MPSNDLGQVVGSAVTSGHANHPFLYSNGQMIDLGTLGSPDGNSWWNSAQGINNRVRLPGRLTMPMGTSLVLSGATER